MLGIIQLKRKALFPSLSFPKSICLGRTVQRYLLFSLLSSDLAGKACQTEHYNKVASPSLQSLTLKTEIAEFVAYGTCISSALKILLGKCQTQQPGRAETATDTHQRSHECRDCAYSLQAHRHTNMHVFIQRCIQICIPQRHSAHTQSAPTVHHISSLDGQGESLCKIYTHG